MTKPIQKQRTLTRNNFVEHNYNYVNRPQTSKPSRPNTQHHLFSPRQNFQHPTANSVKFYDYPRISQDQSENYPFFQQTKNNRQQKQHKQKTPYYNPIFFHQMMTIFITKIINKFFKTKDPTLITYINQIFLNHSYKHNIRDNLDQITHPEITIFIHKTQLIQIIINQHKCKMNSHYLITYNNMKSQKVN